MLIAIYLAAAHLVCRSYLWFPNLASNPELAMLASLTDVARPVASGSVPAAYLPDFEPNSHSRATAAMLLNTNPAEGAIAHPLNVLMVVMESVGAHYLSACGANYADSPAIDGLAAHGISFGRIYAAQPNSSAAMTALFCSLYPDHDWLTVPRETPNVPIAGLAAVLAHQGYRTGFIHIGKIDYDHEDEFLRAHGIGYIAAEAHDERRSADLRALPLATDWIKADRARPFFLTIWTQDTHNPYVTAAARHYGVQSAALDRYLNGIRSTDDLIARLQAMLDDNHLADSTLLVITGDHGEAFGEHGELIHGFTVYDEEVRVPLIIVNPKLIGHWMTVDRVGRQIDIAPTILQLLGVDRPAGWQGESLLSAGPPRRAYLFAADGGLTFGLVDGDLKYIYQLESGRSQLYDLQKDPAERHDLSSQSDLAGVMVREHARIEAWISFQNRYLRSLTRN
jgi:lipoteichoic acid synthase